MRFKWAFALLLELTLLFSPLALLGQPTPNNTEKAKSLINEGKTFFASGEYEKALKAFTDAYTLDPQTKLLPPIGQCYRELGRYQEAIDAYNLFLKEAAPDHKLRPEVERELAETQGLLPKKNPDAAKDPEATTDSALPATTPAEEPNALPEKQPLSPRFFYGVAGASGGVGLVLGALSVGATLKARQLSMLEINEDLDVDSLNKQLSRSRYWGISADVLMMGAAVVGVVGYRLQKKDHQRDLQAGIK